MAVETTIGALLDETGGSIKTGPFGTKLKASEYTDTGVPVISVGEVGLGRLRIHHNTPRVDETISNRMPEFLLKSGDIVFGRKGAVERSAQVQPDEDGYFLGSDGIRIRLNDEKCDPKFISYQLQTSAHRNWMIQHAAGTTMPSLNEGIIRLIPIVLKPIAEQKRIAEVLGALDDKIELNRRMNASLEATARALFQSWFVDFDPVRAKLDGRQPSGMDAATAALFPHSFEESPLGKIPQGWKAKQFVDVLTPRTERVGSATLPEFSATIDGLSSRDERFKKQLSKSQSKNKRIIKGDLVFGFSREVINFGLMRADEGAVSPVYEVFKVDPSKIDPELLERLFRFNMFYYMDILKPGAREGKPIDRNYLLQKHLLVPDIAVQQAFLKTIQPWMEKLRVNEAESRTLATLRDTLLPKLLSGELSLKEAA